MIASLVGSEMCIRDRMNRFSNSGRQSCICYLRNARKESSHPFSTLTRSVNAHLKTKCWMSVRLLPVTIETSRYSTKATAPKHLSSLEMSSAPDCKLIIAEQGHVGTGACQLECVNEQARYRACDPFCGWMVISPSGVWEWLDKRSRSSMAAAERMTLIPNHQVTRLV